MNAASRFIALLFAATLGACGSGSLSVDNGELRLVNATSEFPSLDLFASNSAVVTGVTPLSASGYGALKSDAYTLDVRASGSGATLVSTSTTLAKKDNQTVVAYSSAGTLTVAVLSDKEGDPSNGNAKVRIFNTASADAGNLDVYLVGTDCSTLVTSGAAAFAANVSGLQSAYTQVSSSTTPYHVCVTAPGDKSDLRLDIPSLVLSEKRIVTIVLVRTAGGFLVNGLLLDQQGALTQALNTSARVRVAASVSPAMPVSVDVNGTAVAAGLATPNVGPYRLVNAGPVTVKINGTVVAPAAPATAAPGSDLTVLLTGVTPTVAVLADDNSVSPSTARPVKLRLVNGLNGSTGTVTLTVDNGVLVDSVAFGAASAYSLLPASAALATIEARSGVVLLAQKTSVTLSSGRVYSLFLLGDASTAPNAGFLVADR
jgi:hypothetical protein